MALFESYERRIDQINAALAKFDIKSIEEAKAICDEKGIDVYNKYYIQQASGDKFNEFQDTYLNQVEPEPEENYIPLNNVAPDVDLNTLYQNTTTGGGAEDPTVQYEGYDVIGTIEIPATDVEYPIVADYEMSIRALNLAIVKMYPETIELNQVGNTVLAGHNYKNGTFFSNNKTLQEGDKIYITDLSGERVEYEIYNKYETGSGDSAYMNRDTNGKREISLTTCTDDTRDRLIIWAREVE